MELNIKAKELACDNVEFEHDAHEIIDKAMKEVKAAAIRTAMKDIDISILGPELHIFGNAFDGGALHVCSLKNIFKEAATDSQEGIHDLLLLIDEIKEVILEAK